MDSSVFRAVLMWSLTLIALFRWKEVNTRYLIWLVYILMLLYNPYFLVYDVGFIFSFSALIWIIYFGNFTISTSHKLYKILWEYFFPSVGATIWILPSMLFFMSKTNLVSIFWNLLILPLIPFAMIYGFLSLFLYQILWREFILQIEKRIIDYIYLISQISGKYWLYITTNSYWIKYFILILSIIWFIYRRFFYKNSQVH